jgi:hypothetical protein
VSEPGQESLEDLAIGHPELVLPKAQGVQNFAGHQRDLAVEAQGELIHRNHVEVALQKLTKAAVLGTLAAPAMLNLVALEGKAEIAEVLRHVASKRHRQIVVQTELRLLVAFGPRVEPRQQIHLFVGVPALGHQDLEPFYRRRLDRRKAVELEDVDDAGEHRSGHELLLGSVLGKSADALGFHQRLCFIIGHR